MTTKRLVKNRKGGYEWVEVDSDYFKGSSKREMPAGDPTIEQHISQHGGIYSHADRKVYTSKRSYLDSLKANNQHIVDY